MLEGRRRQKQGKRLVLKDKILMTTAEIRDGVQEAERATAAKSKGKGKGRAPAKGKEREEDEVITVDSEVDEDV